MATIKLVGAALAITLLAAPAAHAQVTIDVSKITCEQFLLFKVVDPDYIALWLSGYFHGKTGGGTVIDTQEFKENIRKLREYCRGNLQQPVMQAVEMRLRSGK
jgi:acid stress chaperone HdeB